MGLESRSERACLLIADISGYTSYMQGVELDHAQDVIADLITAVVTPLHSHFKLNKLEGDAAFMYSPAENVDGSTILDMIEASYFSFRRRVRSIERATTCECGACSLIPRLDLKVVVHQGTVGHQVMLGHDELVGNDVVLVHRLLKNDVEESTGTKAYALFTQAAVDAAGLEPELLDMKSFTAEVDDVGEEYGWVFDLDLAWRKEQARRRVYVDAKDSVFTMEHLMAGVEPGVVWEWLTKPALKAQFQAEFEEIVAGTDDPRRGVGTQVHCVHGEGAIKEEIIDWRPPSYMTYKGTMTDGEPFVATDEVVEAEGGVVVRRNIQPATADDRQAVIDALRPFEEVMINWFPRLERLINEQADQFPDVGEPELPQPDESGRLATSVGPSITG